MRFFSNVFSTAAGVFIGLCAYAAFLRWMNAKPKPTVFIGGTLLFEGFDMFVVKANHPDTGYTVTLPTEGRDAEGHIVALDPAKFSVSVESDNPAAVEMLPDEDGDNLMGKVRFGGPGPTGEPSLANVNAVLHYDGRMVASYGAQFTVTAGDVETFGGGGIAFDNLEEVPEPTEPEPTEPGEPV